MLTCAIPIRQRHHIEGNDADWCCQPNVEGMTTSTIIWGADGQGSSGWKAGSVYDTRYGVQLDLLHSESRSSLRTDGVDLPLALSLSRMRALSAFLSLSPLSLFLCDGEWSIFLAILPMFSLGSVAFCLLFMLLMLLMLSLLMLFYAEVRIPCDDVIVFTRPEGVASIGVGNMTLAALVQAYF